MSQSSVDKLGSMLGGMSRGQNELNQNISSDDAGQAFNFEFSVPIALKGTVLGKQLNLATDSFVLDHPVYGDLDNSSLILDGGYAESIGANFTFPGTFPMTFSGGTTGTSIAFTVTF